MDRHVKTKSLFEPHETQIKSATSKIPPLEIPYTKSENMSVAKSSDTVSE